MPNEVSRNQLTKNSNAPPMTAETRKMMMKLLLWKRLSATVMSTPPKP